MSNKQKKSPDPVPSACVEETGVVLSVKPLVAGYWLMTLRAAAVSGAARPGQFVHLRVPGLEASALRRPFSIYGAEKDELRLMFKTVGRGSEALSGVKPGERISVLGPLGNGFPLDACAAGATPLCVAGGYGVAPLSFLASRVNQKGVVLLGGRTADDVLAADDFRAVGWRVEIATQDGSLGVKGLVTALLDTELIRQKEAGKQVEIFACGPGGMLKAVGDRAEAAGYRAWLSLDKRMVCGVGACLACVQRLRRSDGQEWLGRVCKDGPVFESREIVW